MNNERQKILGLIIDRALLGSISLEEFYETWPLDENDEDEFYSKMFDDIECAIEYTPFKFFAKKVNTKIWKNMNEYKTLLFYKSLIKKDILN